MAFDLSLVGKPGEPVTSTYTWKDTVLYALAIGAKTSELDYLFEGRGPKVYPSFAVIPEFEPMFERLRASGGDLSMVVYGGEKVVIKKPLPPAATITTRSTIKGIYDLKRLAIMLLETDSMDVAGDVLARTTATIIFRGDGGFGGEPPPKEKPDIAVPKDKAPDFRIEEPTTKEQALLYRLTGDLNPLHADPDFAKKVGFEQGPILHGMCSFGHMVRHVAKGACGGDATKLSAFEAQFKKPVWPGDTLVTEGWIVEEGKVALQVKVKERDEIVIGGAWATLL